ncbi:MAG: glucose-6-phosphate isomerase, partial [Sphingobacteriales bacterium]
MSFDPGFNVRPLNRPLGFAYGDDCFGPVVETRKLNDIRKSLRDPDCDGPEIVYAIAMDVGKKEHKAILHEHMLLYGAVTYAAGKMGDEPVRSQGHIHKKSSHSGWSPPEMYEIWSGSAIIYMQEYAEDNPGRCFAVYAKPGDVVVVPPEWAHATISADPQTPLTFGAWCDREYGFLYDRVRAKKGLAWFPVMDEKGEIVWKANPNY